MKKATGCRATWSLVLMSVMVLFATACTSPSKEFMKAQQDDTQASYRRFLDQYPSGTFSDKAKTRIAEIDRDKQERAEKKAEQEAFALAVRRGDEAALRQHLMQYPGPVFINAAHASEISARLADIEREKQKQAEQDAFELAKRKDTVEAYDAFLNTWPNSPHQQEARQRLKWQEVDPLNVDSLEAFISEFPASPHNASARALLTMQRRLAIYRNGTAVPQFTMTAKQMGRRWADSKKHVTDRDIFGYGYVETTWRAGYSDRWERAPVITCRERLAPHFPL